MILSRIQFALTVGFHYIFPPVTIGMSWIIFWILTKHLKTGDELYLRMGRFWIKIFAVSFAIGVASGIPMEFQFGTNWAEYSRFVGDIFGAPLAAEGVLAFFLESTFLGVMLFGEKKVSRKVYWFSSLMVAVGATLSAFWIIVANSWQQTPAGYHIVNGRAELTSIWEAVWNPSTVPRYLHTIDGAIITGAFFIMGLSAWFIIRGRHLEFARKSFQTALVFGFISAVAVLPLGHYHAVQVTETQPAKLAAMEGLWETTDNAPLLLLGIPNAEEERTDFAVGIPGLLSIMAGGKADTTITGLKDVPAEERPPVALTFYSFHLMVGLGFYFIILTSLGMILWWRGRLMESGWFLRLTLWSIPLPFIANELGWIAAEVGRQPWIVYGVMKTRDAFSTVVPGGQVLSSILMFSAIYTLLFCVWIYLLRRKLNKGPEGVVTA